MFVHFAVMWNVTYLMQPEVLCYDVVLLSGVLVFKSMSVLVLKSKMVKIPS